MSEPTLQNLFTSPEERIDQVASLLATEQTERLTPLLQEWSLGDIAAVLEGLPPGQRLQLWPLIPEQFKGDVLIRLYDQVRSGILDEMDAEAVVSAAAEMESPDLADIIHDLSDEIGEAILESLGKEERSQLEMQLAHGEDTAGRIMRTEWVAVRSDVQLETVARYLRRRGALPATDGLMVVDRDGRYEGKLPIEHLLTLDLALKVGDVMLKEADYVATTTKTSDIALMFERRELLSLAVLDEDHHLVGRIAADDAMALIRAEAEAPMMQMAGLQEDEDLFAPIVSSASRRMF